MGRYAVKKLVINGRFLCRNVTGVERYSHELLRGIDDLLASNSDVSTHVEVELVAPRERKFDFAGRAIHFREIGTLSGHGWEQYDLARYCRGHLLFTPSGGAPLFHSDHVITIHDIGYVATPKAYSRGYRKWYQLMHHSVASRARHVITDSEFSKRELQRWLGIKAEKITVAHLGHEHVCRTANDMSILLKHSLEPYSYILCVSSLNPNKNFGRLIEAYGLLPFQCPLVIVGAENPGVFGNSARLSKNVTWTGYISDPELRALYEHAACFVFPSLYEGFGLPPLEAMALGCPVVLSKAASLPEIGGDVTEYCDPLNARSIADAVALTLRKPANRCALRKHAEMFKWTNCARTTWSVLGAELRS